MEHGDGAWNQAGAHHQTGVQACRKLFDDSTASCRNFLLHYLLDSMIPLFFVLSNRSRERALVTSQLGFEAYASVHAHG